MVALLDYPTLGGVYGKETRYRLSSSSFARRFFSRLLMQEEEANRLRGIQINRGAPHISHMMFANDLMVFCQAKTEETTVKSCLQKYSLWSGQKLNIAKSGIFFSPNCHPQTKSQIGQELDIHRSALENNYLSLPLSIPWSKKADFHDIKEQIFSEIHGWKAKCLSQAGRLTLIKSVAATIPSYSMSSFLLPKRWCRKVDNKLKDFFWGLSDQSNRHFTLVAWSSISGPKS